jgi:8-hydroxy-5-deazaflavin:NADPH oxidoreductase
MPEHTSILTPSSMGLDAQPTDLVRRRLLIAGLGAAATWLVPVAGSGQTANRPGPSAGNDPSRDSLPRRTRIGVIGAGSLGGTVGRLWVRAGYEVLFSSRHPEELVSMTRELGPRASAGTSRQAAEFGTIVLFAVPYDALPQLGKDLGGAIRGKILLDACNPSAGSRSEVAREAEATGVGVTSAKLLSGTRLVRAFSAVDATAVDASARRATGKLGVPIAGDDREAVQVAAQLVRDAGCEPVVVGDLAAARSFQRGGPGFRANTTAPELRHLLGLPGE